MQKKQGFALLSGVPQVKMLQLWLVLSIFIMGCQAQIPGERPHCDDPAFDQKVSQTIRFSVPLISAAQLQQTKEQVFIFDTRNKKEYDTSHIPEAVYLGYRDFDIARLGELPKDSKIVLYCSIGYRSEKIGEKLGKLGYANVFNLYGSIFEWVNLGYDITGYDGMPTRKLHTYNKSWSKWVTAPGIEKVW